MKKIALATVALMCSAGFALAADEPSGRPGQILSDNQCQQAWDRAGGKDGSISETKARPYTPNFKRLDTSNDRNISFDEWKAGCNKGWVSMDAKASDQKG